LIIRVVLHSAKYSR